MKTVKRETWKNERSRRTNTLTDLSGVFTPCVFFFFLQNSAMGKLPSLQPLRGPCGRPAAWFVRKAIYECDPVCARSESLWRHFFSLFVFLTFSIVHFLTCSLANFPVSHFLICSLFTSSLANFLVSNFLSCSLFTSLLANYHFLDFGVISKPLGVSCRTTSERSKH